MTFIYSLLNNLDDIEQQYQNESDLWNSLYFLRNFNNRKCDCLDKYLVDNTNEVDDTDELDSDNNLICQCTYPRIDEDITQDDITVIKSVTQTSINKLCNEDIITVLIYLKNKGVNVTHNDLLYDTNTESGLKECVWNQMLIEIYNLRLDDIKRLKQNRLYAYGVNYNILRVISGMASLNYST